MEAPNILTIALKRFQVIFMVLSLRMTFRFTVLFYLPMMLLQSGKFGKLNKPIRYPEILDLAPFISGTSDKSPIYRLYGVVVHLDIMNASFSGHYVCYVKNVQNKWFKIDDSTVSHSNSIKLHFSNMFQTLYGLRIGFFELGLSNTL